MYTTQVTIKDKTYNVKVQGTRAKDGRKARFTVMVGRNKYTIKAKSYHNAAFYGTERHMLHERGVMA